MHELAVTGAVAVVLAAALELAYFVLHHQAHLAVRVVVLALLVKEWFALSLMLASFAGRGGIHPAVEIMGSALLFGLYRTVASRRRRLVGTLESRVQGSS